MLILAQFLFRLSFGLALAMAITPSRHVTSGFYRVHLLVVMGLMTLASMVAFARPDVVPLALPATAAVLSYMASVVWLYEKPRAGVAMLYLIAAIALCGGWMTMGSESPPSTDAAISPGVAQLINWLTTPAAGLLLGFTITAMLLGHWYLNTPTMDLVPLRRLVKLMAAATIARTVLCGTGLAVLQSTTGVPEALGQLFWPLLALRWLAGLLGVLVLAWMTWQTLKIPNTQSATGILYVALIGAFVGELAGQLLSAESPLPL